MPALYLTPASISYLNQFLLSMMITIYLGQRFLSSKWSKATKQDILLFVFFIFATIFSLSLFLDISFLPSERLPVVYLENTILGVLLVALIQFSYCFPVEKQNQKLERLVALLFSSAYAVVEAGFAVWRFAQLWQGHVEFRPNYMDALPVVEFLWVIFVFARGAIQGWSFGPNRRFALIFTIPFILAALNLLRTYNLVSASLYHISLSIGILFTLLAFALNYLSSKPDRTSLMIKVSGATITSGLALFGVIAWLVAPAYSAQYRPANLDQQTLFFTPNQQGGYDLSRVPFHFETDLGQSLGLRDSTSEHPSVASIAFSFPFYGQQYENLFISDDGFISFGTNSLKFKDLEYRFSSIPMIMGLMLDLNPGDNPGKGVFLRHEAEKLVITYWKVGSFWHPENQYTFQIILHTHGSIEISYNGLPVREYDINDRPDAAVWAIGLKPAGTVHQSYYQLPSSNGPDAFILDEYRSFRTYLHTFLLPIAITVLISSLIFIFALPLALNYLLTGPVNTLISGVDLLNQGQLDVRIPVHFNDEIGFLTQSFNNLANELNNLIKTLESRVTDRTAELLTANEQLSKLSIAVEQSPSSIIIANLDASIEYVNPAFTRSTGYTFEEIRGKNPRILKSNLTPAEIYQEMWSALLAGKTWRGELLNRKKNGETHWEYTVIAPIRDEKDTITHYVAIKEDITGRKQTEQWLKESEKQYRDLFEMESDAIFIIRNSDNAILESNSAAIALYGFSHAEFMNKKNTDLSAEPEETQKATKSPVPADEIVSIPLRWHRKNNGVVFPVEITARFIHWRGQDVHIAAIRDVTERYQAEKELQRLAITDSLTGLFTRGHFFVEAEKILIRSHSPSCDLTVFMLDIDHFKKVNDTYGHHVGDIVLQEVTRLLHENLRPSDLFARYGGEEFVALLHRTPCAEIPAIAERLVRAINEHPIRVDGMDISVTISMGAAQRTEKVASLYELLSCADKAMYMAKQAGRNRWENYKEESNT